MTENSKTRSNDQEELIENHVDSDVNQVENASTDEIKNEDAVSEEQVVAETANEEVEPVNEEETVEVQPEETKTQAAKKSEGKSGKKQAKVTAGQETSDPDFDWNAYSNDQDLYNQAQRKEFE